MLTRSLLHICLVASTVSAAYGQDAPVPKVPAGTPKTDNSFSQKEIDAAMERLRERQRQRDSGSPAATQPVPSETLWATEGEHTRERTSQRKSAHIALCMQAVSAYSKTATKDDFSKRMLDDAKALLEALRACSLEQYRDATLDCWNRNDAELKRQWGMWDSQGNFDKTFGSARSALLKNDSMRSIQYTSKSTDAPIEEPDGSRWHRQQCRFQFVTKGGVVEEHNGWVRIDAVAGRGTFISADIDGSPPDMVSGLTLNLDPIPWPWKCSWTALRGVGGQLIVDNSASLPDKVQPEDMAKIRANQQAEKERRALNAGSEGSRVRTSRRRGKGLDW